MYEFGSFQVYPGECLLLRKGRPVPLTPKAFDTLVVLIRGHGHLFEKSELIKAVWADTFVEEGNLAVAISVLRKVLGDKGSKHNYIQTVARRGYRFVGAVREITDQDAERPPAKAASSVLSPEAPHPGVLRLPVLKFAVLGLTVLGVIMGLMHFRRSRDAAEVRSLAALPFRTLNAGAAQDYVGFGLADAIITKLGSTGRIIVRPTSSVMKYANSPADPLAVGREERVDAVLSGNIEVLPERVRVTAQLIRTSNGALLWADAFEGSPRQMAVLEDKVIEGIVQSMSVSLLGEAKIRMARRDTGNSKADQLYWEGRYFWNKRTEESIGRSIEYFLRAADEDPQFALAYAGLADSYVLLGSYGLESPQQAYQSAKAAVVKALELDDSLAEAHASLGTIYFHYEWSWSSAEQEFQRSIALNPNYAVAHKAYAAELRAMGRFDEAINHVRRAQELDPLSLITNTEVGSAYYSSGQHRLAIDALQRVIRLDPQFGRAHMRLGMAYAAERSFDDAIQEFVEAQRLSRADAYLDGLLGYAEALSGNTGKARDILKELIHSSHNRFGSAFSIALIYIGLGERNRALEWLDKAYQERSANMVFVKTDPLLDPVRSEPRFRALLYRMRLM